MSRCVLIFRWNFPVYTSHTCKVSLQSIPISVVPPCINAKSSKSTFSSNELARCDFDLQCYLQLSHRLQIPQKRAPKVALGFLVFISHSCIGGMSPEPSHPQFASVFPSWINLIVVPMPRCDIAPSGKLQRV